MIKKIVAIALAATSFAASAADANNGFYLGADVGRTKIDDLGNGTSYGIVGGYQFTPNLALELGYRELGDFDYQYYIYSMNVKARQTAISMVGTLPLGSGYSVYGRLGYNQLKASVAGFSGDTNTGLLGIGLGYDFTPAVTGRVEIQRPSSDSTNVSVGVVYKF